MKTKITLYNAISIDGYIAKNDGDSTWVTDKDDTWYNTCVNTGCIIVGRTTFEQFYEEPFPIERVLNIVVTHDPNFEIKHINVKPVHSMKEAKDYMESHEIPDSILVGGGTVNSSFLKENYIDQIIIVVHPLILGNGIKLFEDIELDRELELQQVKDLENGTVQLTYLVP